MELTPADDALTIFFDPIKDEQWPDGAFACGIPGSDFYYALTADDAYAAWRAAPSPAGGA